MQLKQLAALGAGALFFASLAGVSPAGAQDQPPQRPNRPSPDEAVKTILDLSDAQLQQLKDLRDSVAAQRQDHATEIRRLQQQQRELLKVSPPDAAALADILVQQQNLQKQIQDENTAFRDGALNLLTASQKEKVQSIQDALELVRNAGPLAQFGLIDGPGGRGGPGGVGGFGGGGFGGRGGARFQGQFQPPPPPPQP
jgi:Spy/CpxP family protein refolding chaperone